MNKKKSKKPPKIYYIAPNGIKIELKRFGPASFYAQEQVRTEFAKAFQVPKDLASLREKLPSEARQCEIIWKPVYDEYRRIGYRLKEKK